MPKVRKLSEKQKAFVREYLIDLNATQAAVRAGYSTRTAKGQGSRLLTKVHVQKAVAKGAQKSTERAQLSTDDVLREFMRLGFADMADFISWTSDGSSLKSSEELTRDQTRAISEIIVDSWKTAEDVTQSRIKLKLHDKRAALEALAKHLGLFINKHELTGKDGRPIEVERSEGPDLSHLTAEELVTYAALLEKVEAIEPPVSEG